MVSSVCGTELYGSLVAIPVAALVTTRVGTAFAVLSEVEVCPSLNSTTCFFLKKKHYEG